MHYLEGYRQYDIVVKNVSPDCLGSNSSSLTYWLGDFGKVNKHDFALISLLGNMGTLQYLPYGVVMKIQ